MEKLLNWFQEHKKYVLIGAGIVLLLAAAFWYGSGSPDSQGFSVSKEQKASEQTASKTERNTKGKPGNPTEEAIAEQKRETAAALVAQAQEKEEPSGSSSAKPEQNGSAETTGNTGNGGASGGSSQTGTQSVQNPNSQGVTVPQQTTSKKSTMEINPDTGKDKYQTDPVPEGKPEPVEPEEAEPGPTTGTCTISISCATILGNMDALDKKKVSLIPKDGWILKPETVSFQEGESVFDVLQRVCKEKKIHMEFSYTPIYNSAYIEGIYNIYEFDVGSLSGWTYKVNDWFPNYGCSRYQLNDGDTICWAYTCNLGKDVGGSMQSNE